MKEKWKYTKWKNTNRPWESWTKQEYDNIFSDIHYKKSPFRTSIVAVAVITFCIIAILILKVIR